jgi:hypothetical protein
MPAAPNMRAMLLALLLSAFAGAAPGTLAAEADLAALERAASFRPRIVLRARLESAQAPEPRRLREIAAEIAGIWAPYLDVVVAWPGDVVARGLDDLLELVITDRLPENRSPHALGWIEFLTPSRPASTISVSVASARRLAAEAPWAVRAALAHGEMRERFVARALGRGIAHELGHYLLRAPGHAARGLMRPHFDAADMLNTRTAKFRLDASQAVLLNARLLQYQYARRADAGESVVVPQ